ncbi:MULTISPECIES: ATP-binding cassette domain-containing protein [unclassified Microbacterium]|uniref:ATP-binding cassette domain-containing protein n=1 Tax=unclassified Microbacterium TaxID=2609290 RepID=UPI0030158D2A
MTGIGVAGIRVTFGDTTALDDVTLAVPSGRVSAVVGGDGAGKTTLLRVLAGRVATQAGEVHTLGTHEIGFQPATSGVWGGLTVDENVAFVARAFGMTGRAAHARAGVLLERAGLAEARARLGRDLSGGMRQKLGFVLAILHEPRLVLLDEPSTGVDPVSRVELWRLIAEAAASGTAVLLGTTYLDEAARAAEVTALDRGVVIGSGTPDEIIASVPGRVVAVSGGAPATSDAASRTWRRGPSRRRWLPPAATGAASPGVADAPGSDDVVTMVPIDLEDALIALTLARENEPGAALGGGPSIVAPARQAPGNRDSRRPAGALAVGRGVSRRFGRHLAVDDVSITVERGEIVGLIGANGAGKTTFLRTLIGLDRADAGDVRLFGRPPSAATRTRLGYVPQGSGLSPTISADANAAFFARVYGTPVPPLPPGIRAVATRPVGTIGLGLQRQLAFVLALAHEPELLVLDEPTSGVDPLARARLWDTIHAQADAGAGVIVTTHYLQEAEQCTRLALLSQGRLVGTGSVAELTAGVSALVVRAEDWQRAFDRLTAAGLPTMLDGRTVRVAGAAPADVRLALGDLPAAIDETVPTLEEVMALHERAGSALSSSP